MLDVLICLVLVKDCLNFSIFSFRFAEASSGDDSDDSNADVYEGEDTDVVGHDSLLRNYSSVNILV